MTTSPNTVSTERAQAGPAAQDGSERTLSASPFLAPESPAEEGPGAALVIKGRNVEVPDHFRTYVGDKLSKLERFDRSIYQFGIELQHEPNRRQAKNCQRVELTATGKGPVVRAEACGDTFYAALELAVDKLESRLRRAHDRRTVHHGRHTPVSVAEATAALAAVVPEADGEPEAEQEGPGRIVRVKEHPAQPMTVDEALYEMELVGHDFFLFHCAETGQPSVVYRRHAFDYGLIRLV